jgi:hypothetical protein
MRGTVAFVHKVNGAYLIQWCGEIAMDRSEEENFSAAGSLVRAKKVAVDGARAVGYGGAVRWLSKKGYWELEMTDPEDDDGY